MSKNQNRIKTHWYETHMEQEKKENQDMRFTGWNVTDDENEMKWNLRWD